MVKRTVFIALLLPAEVAFVSSSLSSADHSVNFGQLIQRAAAAGNAVLCEKPIGLNIAEVDDCLDELKKTPTPLLLGFNRRFDPSAAAMKHANRCSVSSWSATLIPIGSNSTPSLMRSCEKSRYRLARKTAGTRWCWRTRRLSRPAAVAACASDGGQECRRRRDRLGFHGRARGGQKGTLPLFSSEE
jgi:hypothetical protein